MSVERKRIFLSYEKKSISEYFHEILYVWNIEKEKKKEIKGQHLVAIHKSGASYSRNSDIIALKFLSSNFY